MSFHRRLFALRRPRAARLAVAHLPGLLVGLALLGLPLARSLDAQSGAASPDEPAWNGIRVLELVDRARAVRSDQMADSALRSYQSRANAFVYFYIDRPDEEERTLVKADQLALDVFWGTPDRTRQRIVGRRDETVLPTNIRYHLDHLTVVQDEFGDVIRLGDGDEVGAVPHPIGTGGPATYDYRLADSLTISTGGFLEPVRVYEVLVRPRDPDLPGFVGSVYIDRATASIVRMSFTFTAASYVDPYLDYIRISLDNALWEEKWWLPRRQELEVRREMPVIDFLAGSVIRGRFEVGDYRFNVGFDDAFFDGPAVTQLPPDALARFDFDDDLYADLERTGLGPTADLEEIEARVREIGIQNAIDGLSPVRLHWGSFSEAVRYDRAEGWVLGLGTAFDFGERRLRLLGARAFAAGEFQARASFEQPAAEGTLRVIGRANRPADVGPRAGLEGALNTIASLAGSDYTDLYSVSGAELGWRGRIAGHSVDLALIGQDERARPVAIDDADGFRPALDALPLRRIGGRAEVRLTAPGDGRATFTADGAAIDPAALEGRGWAGGVKADAEWVTPRHRSGRYVEVELDAGLRFGDLVAQDLGYLGGLGTLPGQPFRDRAGDAWLLASGRVGSTLVDPVVALHALAAVGWTRAPSPESLLGTPRRPTIPGDEGWRASVGVGTDLFWRVIRLDVVRGLGADGRWTVSVSVRPDLSVWL